MKEIITMILFLLLIASVSSLEITSPENKEYNIDEILINVSHNEQLDSIIYVLDTNSEKKLCDNCTAYSGVIDLAEGNHKIIVYGAKGNESYNDTVEFSINFPEEDFKLNVVKPTARTYDLGKIDIKIVSNETLDTIRVKIGGYDEKCDNCSKFEDSINLSEGNYTLRAKGTLGDKTKEVVVSFKVENKSEIPKPREQKNESHGKPKYNLGFEKLPQMLESGNITDSELTEILKNNQLNPGIINRLIKTGKLGNESLTAILDYQEFKPMGLWNKVLSFFGYKGHTYAAQIAEKYDLPEKIEQKLIKREDMPKGLAKKVQERLEEHIEEKVKNKLQNQEQNEDGDYKNKSNGKSIEIGKQMPPGQAKKLEEMEKKGNNGKGKGKN